MKMQHTIVDTGIFSRPMATAPGHDQQAGAIMIRPLSTALEDDRLEAVRESEAVLREHFIWCGVPYDAGQNRHYIQRVENAWREEKEFHFAVWHRHDNQYLGEVAIDWIAGDKSYLNLVYWVRQSRQNNGYATAAVKLLLQMAPQLVAVDHANIMVETGNESSKRVAEKTGAGLREIKSASTVRGTPADYHCFHYRFQ
jgi:RimJ/RimL family protein N-acetyltransferase